MAHPVLPLLVALSYTCVPAVNLHAQSKDPIACMKTNPSCIIIADTHAGDDPHGDDPHGADPHDEQHDPGLPANQHRHDGDNGGASKRDPYGGTVPNTPQPYTP